MVSAAPFLRFVIAGLLTRDFLVLPDGNVLNDVPGGNLLYTAAGMALWDENIGFVGRINEDYPREWLEKFKNRGFDVRGIQVDTEYKDHRNFIAYPTIDGPSMENPLGHYARVEKPLPKSLLGYVAPKNTNANNYSQDSAIRLKEIPFDYLDVTAVHISALDFASQTRLPSFFRLGHATTISMLAANEYMNSLSWDVVPTVITGINALICTEEQIRALFLGRSSDVWEMVEGLAMYGVEYIVIKTPKRRYMVYDHISKKRFELPQYGSRVIDPTGSLDAFCGGFLAGLREEHQPVVAAMKGSISASLADEGSGPFYCSDALPALVSARYDALKSMVIQI
ncbi:MAG: hypothetical protein CVU39_01865 [Chloroflexi bacterium HGW-Chloroflexi-10]|nr:MAG: hypothetical protein CVU39_01865 [Chloroflexi bacterium HGW-Chloroflexi-10]